MYWRLVWLVKPHCQAVRLLKVSGRALRGRGRKSLQVYAANPRDAVRLVRIMKDGTEVVPGTYVQSEMSEDYSSSSYPVEDWLRDASFVLKNQTGKTIVCVGMSVVFPARTTGIECSSITGSKSAWEPWCEAHPHWCDGGCPDLIRNTLHWA